MTWLSDQTGAFLLTILPVESARRPAVGIHLLDARNSQPGSMTSDVLQQKVDPADDRPRTAIGLRQIETGAAQTSMLRPAAVDHDERCRDSE